MTTSDDQSSDSKRRDGGDGVEEGESERGGNAGSGDDAPRERTPSALGISVPSSGSDGEDEDEGDDGDSLRIPSPSNLDDAEQEGDPGAAEEDGGGDSEHKETLLGHDAVDSATPSDGDGDTLSEPASDPAPADDASHGEPDSDDGEAEEEEEAPDSTLMGHGVADDVREMADAADDGPGGRSEASDDSAGQEDDAGGTGDDPGGTVLGHDAPTGLSEETDQQDASMPAALEEERAEGSEVDDPEPVEADALIEEVEEIDGEEGDATAEASLDDEGEVLVGGEEEYEDEPTMLADDFLEQVDGEDEVEGGEGAHHGEASLEINEEAEGVDEEFDEYEKTVVSDQMFSGGDSSEADGGPGVSVEDFHPDAPADGGAPADESSEPAAGASEPSHRDRGEAPREGAAHESSRGDAVGAGEPSPDAAAPSHQGGPPDQSSERSPAAGGGQPADPPAASGGRPSDQPARPPESGRAGGAGSPADPGPPDGSASSGAPAEGGGGGGEEPDEEFASQKTALFDSPFENDPICPRLSVLEGPSAGQEFLLNGLRNSIGRGTDNSIVIPDEAISRQHLEIVKNSDDTYSLQDLQSVNGTYVNGKRIEEADLFHGDRIKVGKTVCQFMVPGEQPQQESSGDRRMVPAASETMGPGGEAPAPQSASPPDRDETDRFTRWATYITFGFGTLCLLLIAGFLVLEFGMGGGASKGPSAARKHYRQGVQAVRERNWSEARTHFEKAKQKNAKLDGLDKQLSQLDVETKAQKNLERARESLEEGDTKKALTIARDIPRGSVYYEDAQELVRRQKRKKRLASLHEEAQDQHEEGEMEKALTTIQSILDIAPNHGKALALQRRILSDVDEAEEKAARREARERAEARKQRQRDRRQQQAETETTSGSPTEVATREQPSGSEASPSDDSPSESSEGESWLIGDDEDSTQGGGSEDEGGTRVVNFEKGFLLYKQKQFEAALRHFEEAAQQSGGSVSKRAEVAAQNIARFQQAFQAARTAIDQGRWKKASNHLRSALAADKKVSSQGFFTNTITRKLARVTAERGIALVGRGQYPRAYQLYKNAAQYDDSHSRVRTLLRKLESEAKKLYIKAANKRKTNPGETGSICRRIMKMLPPDSTHYKKAEELLAEL